MRSGSRSMNAKLQRNAKAQSVHLFALRLCESLRLCVKNYAANVAHHPSLVVFREGIQRLKYRQNTDMACSSHR